MSNTDPLPGQGDFFDLLGESGDDYKVKPEPTEEEKITPKARKIIEDHNNKYAPVDGDTDEIKKKNEENAKKIVDLDKVQGSGKDGKITVSDAQNAVNRKIGYQGYTPPVKTEPEPEEYDKDRVVYYAGNQIPVPDRKMKLEDVRVMLQKDFPELTKERAELVYEKDQGHIIPVLKGHRKGQWQNTIEVHYDWSPWLDTRPVYRLIAEDGVYEVRKTQAGRFVSKIRTGREMKEGFVLTHGPIPVHILEAAVAEMKAEPEKEMLVNIWWVHTQRGESGYVVEAPKQVGTRASVEAAGSMETEDRYIVLQLHSHGRMPAFWSSTDDADEVRTGLYGVIGYAHVEKPLVKFRFSCGGMYRKVKPAEIFEDGWTDIVRFYA